MRSSYSSTRPRRPLSLGEVGLFAFLLLLVFGFGLYRPIGHAANSSHQPGLALMNIDTSDQPVASRTAQPLPTPPATIANNLPATDEATTESQEEVFTFDGRPLRKVKQLTMLTTAYSPDERSCGKWADGFTASGYSVWTNGMKLVAADTRILPFGTLVSIPGYNGGKPVPVLDRGGKIKGNRLDLLYPTHESALKWGAQRLTVDVWEYAD